MIISHIIGGLGNQMFQYAAVRALSLELNVPLKLDISGFTKYKLHQGFELKRIFDIKTKIADKNNLEKTLGWQASALARRILSRPSMRQFRKKSFVVEPQFNYWSALHKVPSNCYLMGYWQSEKYFIDIEQQLRKDFRFKLPLSEKNARTANQIKTVNAVSVHIRRGDYTSNPKNISIYGVCPPEYYSSAIDHIATQIDNPYFFIFSDDIEWSQANLKIDLPHEYITHNKDSESYNDMHLMSLCKHHIIANSSFSWWGAWLNPDRQKVVIAPKNWFVNATNASDLIPNDWIRL